MARIRITKIYPGATGTTFNKSSNTYNKELDYEYAKEIGLFKYSRWLHNIVEGDTLTVPFNSIEELKNAGNGTFEFEITHPEYANHSVGSDVYPFEIVEWKNERCILVREMDTADYTGCMGEHCETYKSNPNNPVIKLREHKNGAFYEAKTNCCPFILSDKPYYYRDPSF